MVNKVSILGTVCCVLATALSCGLLLTNEFVEIFLSKGNGALSCNIGYLGVRQAAFDPTCLTAEELEGSGLGGVNPVTQQEFFNIEKFESDTTEFKLLFPSQEGFNDEVNIMYSLFLACAAAEDPACSDVARAQQFPTFEEKGSNCDSFWGVGGLQSIQPAVFSNGQETVDGLLFPTFVSLVVEQGVSPWYRATDNTLSLVGDSFAQTMEFYFSFSPNITSLQSFTGFNATQVEDFFQGIIDLGLAPAVDVLGNASAAKVLEFSQLVVTAGGTPCANAATVSECVFSTTLTSSDTTGTNFATQVFSSEWCQVFGPAAGACELNDWAPTYLSIIAINSVQPIVQQITAELLGLIQLARLFNTGNMFADLFPPVEVPVITLTSAGETGLDASTSVEDFQVSSVFAFADATNNFTYPTLKGDQFEVCLFLQLLGQINTTGVCSFQVFIESAFDIAAAGGASDATQQLISSLASLFDTCFKLIDASVDIPNVDECWTFFAAATANNAFAGDLTDTLAAYTPANAGSGTFAAAANACKDDVKDLEAIETAQGVTPVGIVFLGIAALVGMLATGFEKKIATMIAGAIALLGSMLILIALLKVYNAPIYESVGGDDAPENEVVYVAGRTVTIGLASIALGFVSAFCFLVGGFFTKPTELPGPTELSSGLPDAVKKQLAP